MHQLTASEASNDEMERQRFEKWIVSLIPARYAYENRTHFSNGHYTNILVDVAWEGWQAAWKSKQGEV